MKSLYYRCGIPITFYNQTPKMKWHYWGSGIPLAFDNQTLSFQFFDAQITAVLEGPLRTHKVKLKFDKKWPCYGRVKSGSQCLQCFSALSITEEDPWRFFNVFSQSFSMFFSAWHNWGGLLEAFQCFLSMFFNVFQWFQCFSVLGITEEDCWRPVQLVAKRKAASRKVRAQSGGSSLAW